MDVCHNGEASRRPFFGAGVWQKESVDNVHTLGFGSGRTGPDCGCFRGSGEISRAGVRFESHLGHAEPFVRGVFALMCGHFDSAGPSEVVRGLCRAPRWPIWLCGWRDQSPGLWAFRLLESRVCAVLSGCSGGQVLALTHSCTKVVVTT